jgi:histidine ammonia-lyase
MTLTLGPGKTPLAQWREIHQGAKAALDPACRPSVAESAAAIVRILARGAPV